MRDEFEETVRSARRVAERVAGVALRNRAVDRLTPFWGMSEPQRRLRLRLRAHGRSLGCDLDDESGDISSLVEEAAYEHWHRMFFARILAENGLLMYPDPDAPTPVTLDECRDLAEDEGASSGWELAARYAARMLPQIFNPDSPSFGLEFPQEGRSELEGLVMGLSRGIFTASDSLELAYRFWSEGKRRRASDIGRVVNAGVDFGRPTIDLYAWNFLLDNSIGAWWVSKIAGLRADGVELKRGAREKLRTAESEDELRKFFSIAGVPLKYLRFVRRGDSFEPACGWFEKWPDSLSELSVLDPCCGEGGCLTALFSMLVPMRMELDGFSASEASDAVLLENIHGLEPDPRLASAASFSLALSAWRYKGAGGYRRLPEINVACSGLHVGTAREDWERLAGDRHNLRIALGWMYDVFRDAPTLGSLLDLTGNPAADIVRWESGDRDSLSSALDEALRGEAGEDGMEAAVAAQGLARAAALLSNRYRFVVTNAPELPQARQSESLRRFCDKNYPLASGDLSAVYLDRCLRLCREGGVTCAVLPQKWLAGAGYKKFRENLLDRGTWSLLARLRHEASKTPRAETTRTCPVAVMIAGDADQDAFLNATGRGKKISVLDVSGAGSIEAAAAGLSSGEIKTIDQSELRAGRDARTLLFDEKQPRGSAPDSGAPAKSADPERFCRKFWELAPPFDGWTYMPDDDECSGMALSMEECPPSGAPIPLDWDGRTFDDPSRWTFHGHPCGLAGSKGGAKLTASGLLVDVTVLHIATARLLGYRWPAETDGRLVLSEEASAWVLRCGEISRFSRGDGIVCLPAVLGEPPCAERLLDMLAACYGDDWSGDILDELLRSADCVGRNLDFWLHGKFFEQHCRLFRNRPFVWHIWDGLIDGFSALVLYHGFDRKRLETLTYSYLGDWTAMLKRAESDGAPYSSDRLAAAEALKERLELIMTGEAPCDIFVRWKSTGEQPVGWSPDINDGVRLNIRPFMTVPSLGRRGAGALREKPQIKWGRDRGRDDESSPWYGLALKRGGRQGDRVNDHHLKLLEKKGGHDSPATWPD
jgi:hypothetical protein